MALMETRDGILIHNTVKHDENKSLCIWYHRPSIYIDEPLAALDVTLKYSMTVQYLLMEKYLCGIIVDDFVYLIPQSSATCNQLASYEATRPNTKVVRIMGVRMTFFFTLDKCTVLCITKSLQAVHVLCSD